MRRSLIFAVLLAGCAKAGPRLPEQLWVEEIAIPWADAFPSDIAVDGAGRVWFTDRLTHVIGRYDPERGTFDRLVPPTPKSAPYGLVQSPDGALWFAESQVGRIGRIDPRTDSIREYALPGIDRGGPHLLAWSNGRLWFTAREAYSWGWLDPASGRVEVRTVPGVRNDLDRRFTIRGPRPYSIAAVPDGVWIGVNEGAAFYHVRAGVDTLEAHQLARQVPVDSATIRALRRLPDTVQARLRMSQLGVDAISQRRSTSDSRGRVYVGDFRRGRIVRYDPKTEVLEVYPFIDRASATYGIGVDGWDRVWSYQMYTKQIVMIDPATEDRAVVQLRSDGTVRQIAFDNKRKRVWLPISDSGKLGLIQLR